MLSSSLLLVLVASLALVHVSDGFAAHIVCFRSALPSSRVGRSKLNMMIPGQVSKKVIVTGAGELPYSSFHHVHHKNLTDLLWRIIISDEPRSPTIQLEELDRWYSNV
jgi:hypothetical protein